MLLKKIFAALIIAAVPASALTQTDSSTKLILPEGTIVQVKTIKDLSGKQAKVGEIIEFEVADHVIINNYVLVPKGSKASGTVTAARGSQALGIKGKLEFTIDYLYLSTGKAIKLRSTKLGASSRGRGETVVAGAVLLTPLFLLWHGKQAKIPKGTTFSVYVDETTELEANK